MTSRTRPLVGLVAVLLILGFASAVRAQAPKGIAGTWTLNVAKSKFSPGPAPKGMTLTYTPAGEMLKIAVDVTPAEGPARHWEMTGAFDGKDYPVKGNPDADTISMKWIDDSRGESTFRKGGKVMAVNTRVLSADGKTLTITSKGTNAAGQSRTDVQVFERQ